MRRVACLLALLTLTTALVSPVADGGSASPITAESVHASTVPTADSSPPPSPAPVPSPSPAVTSPGDAAPWERLSAPANTTIEVRVRPNRSARWTVTLTYSLDSENETAAFRQYANAYRGFETDRGPSAALFRRVAEGVSSATGRPMAIQDVSRSATVGESTGTVRLSFRWTNLLERTGNRTIRLGDAFSLPANRTWFGTLERNQTLIVRTPDGYSVVNSEAPSFDLRNNSVIISGPVRIDGSLEITYRRTASPGPDVPWTPVAGALVAGAIIVALAIYLRRRDPRPTTNGGGHSVDDGGVPPASGDAADGTSAGAGGPGGTVRDAPDGATAGAGPDAELLSDEERIERLLRNNGGRMKQATIVKETGWSDAKVSQLLSAMADEERVDKLRLGRENLISLPGEVPDESDDRG